ncbi:RNA polymerase subunit AC19 [Coelomomyces lativittatus]|nr:RNA polymerase subunit AC19 [Coelomomyces lativittatus]KAJ1510451.1 RNA polymerase subunit AC19 [Coelomomyces lativittatus]KAJ1512286.1 RNA polymerase subunit AC19 [Coelomomyces lativittatus]
MDEELINDRISLIPIEGIDIEDTSCQTFSIENEDHTLAISLRYIIMKNPQVQYCSYSIPHPTEDRIHFRIQTFPETGISALEALRKGLEDLKELSNHALKLFQDQIKAFQYEYVDRDDL